METTITLTSTEALALSFVAADPQDYVKSAMSVSIKRAADEIVQLTVQHCLDNGIQVPATREAIVQYAFDNAIVKTAAQRNAEAQAAAEAMNV